MDPKGKGGGSGGGATRIPSAFTLIELLVVLAIVSLLLALLLPSLQRARRRARATVCLSHLAQWGTLLAVYAQDNEGRFPAEPPKGIWLLHGASGCRSGPAAFQVGASTYTEGIACCPMAARPAHRTGQFAVSVDANSVPVLGTTGRALAAWEVTSPGPSFRGSVGLNQSLFEPQAPATPEPAREPEPSGPPARRTRRPSPPALTFRSQPHPGAEPVTKPPIREMNALTARGAGNIPMLLDAAVPIHAVPGEGVPPPHNGDGTEVGGMGPFCLDRHDGYVNGLFLDWSVRRMGLKELWTLKWNTRWNPAGPWTKAGGVKPEDWPRWMRRLKDY